MSFSMLTRSYKQIVIVCTSLRTNYSITITLRPPARPPAGLCNYRSLSNYLGTHWVFLWTIIVIQHLRMILVFLCFNATSLLGRV